MYKSSGLAEIVRDPSPLTRHYLDVWFTGTGAFGEAMKLIGWPVSPDPSPLLVWDKNNGLRQDLTAEEKILYAQTLFHYVLKNDVYVLAPDPRKIFSPGKMIATAKVLWSQSKLLVNVQHTYATAKNYVASIPLTVPTDKDRLEREIATLVWPKVIAVDYIGEFIFSALTDKLTATDRALLIQKLHVRISPIDWYTKSMLAWSRLQEHEISEQEFLAEYGFAAGDDYELTKPRYYEVLRKPKPPVGTLPLQEMSVRNLEDLYVALQYLRSEAKRRSLIWISALRDAVAPAD